MVSCLSSKVARSPFTLFGLCIDELEEILLTATSEEEVKHPQLGMFVILLLPYAKDVFFTYTMEYM